NHNTVAIADIDTRKLTRLLREKGAQNGCIMTADSDGHLDEAKAIELAKSFAGIKGMDLAKVCCDQAGFTWTQGSWQLVSPEV
ncbi:carbamoyl-phosphate synthase small subunit, partial [Mycobacterium tuberculosis]|nr:carbamoyl-phosphate synthase small subunit [Mycobacterium tuberculosis]